MCGYTANTSSQGPASGVASMEKPPAAFPFLAPLDPAGLHDRIHDFFVLAEQPGAEMSPLLSWQRVELVVEI